jgi:ankyrin repeat protein
VRGRVMLEVDWRWGCVQEDGSTALMVACSSGHTDIVELLLAAPGLNVNAAYVSCVCRMHVHAASSHCYARC